jgi:hypothetical protein
VDDPCGGEEMIVEMIAVVFFVLGFLVLTVFFILLLGAMVSK